MIGTTSKIKLTLTLTFDDLGEFVITREMMKRVHEKLEEKGYVKLDYDEQVLYQLAEVFIGTKQV